MFNLVTYDMCDSNDANFEFRPTHVRLSTSAFSQRSADRVKSCNNCDIQIES